MAERERVHREQETEEERSVRLENMAERDRVNREGETEEERTNRCKHVTERVRVLRHTRRETAIHSENVANPTNATNEHATTLVPDFWANA
jgi:hypothetical protein